MNVKCSEPAQYMAEQVVQNLLPSFFASPSTSPLLNASSKIVINGSHVPSFQTTDTFVLHSADCHALDMNTLSILCTGLRTKALIQVPFSGEHYC